MKLNETIAANICLLPDAETIEWAYRVSSQAARIAGGSSLLQRGIAIPHVTLWMGLLPAFLLDEVEKSISRLFLPFSVEPGELYFAVSDQLKRSVWSLGIEPNPTLFHLHANVMEVMREFELQEDVVSGHFGEEASEISCRYVQNFTSQHSGRNYMPHITVGYADVLRAEVPGSMEMQAIGIFRMGNGCTCLQKSSS